MSERTQARWVGSVKEDGNVKAAGQGRQARDMVLMLMRDEDGGQGSGIFVDGCHAPEEFAAGEAGVDEDAGAGGRDDSRIALGARG